MAEVTEQEALKRFVNGLKECAASMLKLEDIEKYPNESSRFTYYIRDAIGSAYQLGHMQRNPDFFRIRDQLELLAKQAAMLGLQNHLGSVGMTLDGKNPFHVISEILTKTCEIGQRIATSKPLTKEQLDLAIDRRIKIITPNTPFLSGESVVS
jgi:hypothetical protein